jgi:two-component system response regulator PhoP
MRILVIEDDVELRNQLVSQLTSEKFTVDATGDGKEGLFISSEYPLDAAIVDLGLPGMSGLEVIRALRTAGHVLPILILTARDRWQDKVEGLEAGGDDYLSKPFHVEELLARLKALLRRSSKALGDTLNFAPLQIDVSQQRVLLHGEPVALTTFEYRLLEYLARHAGEVISKTHLADYLYPHDDDRDSNVIEVMIGRLRKKLSMRDAGNGAPIETLRGRGYRFTLGAQP